MQAAPCLARPAEGVRGRAGRGLGAAAAAAAVAARRMMRVMGGGEGGGGLEFDGGGRGGQRGLATATAAAAVVSRAVVRYGERVVLMAVMEVRVLVVLRQSEALVGKLHSRGDFTVFISVADLSQRGLALAEDKVGVGRVQVKVTSGVAVLLLVLMVVHHPN